MGLGYSWPIRSGAAKTTTEPVGTATNWVNVVVAHCRLLTLMEVRAWGDNIGNGRYTQYNTTTGRHSHNWVSVVCGMSH